MTVEMCDPQSLVLYVAGDLDPDKQGIVEKHIAQCSRCKQELEVLQQHQNDMHTGFPFKALKEDNELWLKIQTAMAKSTSSSKEKKMQRTKKSLNFFPKSKPVYALAAMVALLITAAYLYTIAPESNAEIAFYITLTDGGTIGGYLNEKERASLRSKGVRNKGHLLYPGERIQFSYSSKNHRYFILVSVEECGTISTLYPHQGDSSLYIKKGDKVSLPGSFQLDDYIGKELYIAVFSDKKLSVSDLSQEIRESRQRQNSLESIKLSSTRHRTIKTILTKKEKTGK